MALSGATSANGPMKISAIFRGRGRLRSPVYNRRKDYNNQEKEPVSLDLRIAGFPIVLFALAHPKEPLSEAKGRVWRSGADQPCEQNGKSVRLREREAGSFSVRIYYYLQFPSPRLNQRRQGNLEGGNHVVDKFLLR